MCVSCDVHIFDAPPPPAPHLLHSPSYLLWRLCVSQVADFIFQVLCVVQFGWSGINRITMVTYTTVLLVHTVLPILTRLVVTPKDHDNHAARSRTARASIGLWARRILLADAAFDAIYAAIPIAHMFIRYVDIEELLEDNQPLHLRFKSLGNRGGTSKNLALQTMLLQTIQATLLGGTTTWEKFIKLKGRVLPLIFAPMRLRVSFKVRACVCGYA